MPNKLPHPTHMVIDIKTGQKVGSYNSLASALAAKDRKDTQYGAVRYTVKPLR